MSAPKTTEEIKTELLESAYHGYGFLAHLIQQWRVEWLRDAEPRWRPTSEKPLVGDTYAYRSPVSGWTVLEWRDGDDFHAAFKGEWVLLERAPKPKTLAEEAREILSERYA